MIVCSLSFPPCEAHAPYYTDTWPGRLCPFFTLYLKRYNSRKKKFSEHKMCFDFVYDFFSEIFLTVRRIHRGSITNVHTFLCKIPAILLSY